jgi:hypothetical protein
VVSDTVVKWLLLVLLLVMLPGHVSIASTPGTQVEAVREAAKAAGASIAAGPAAAVAGAGVASAQLPAPAECDWLAMHLCIRWAARRSQVVRRAAPYLHVCWPSVFVCVIFMPTTGTFGRTHS